MPETLRSTLLPDDTLGGTRLFLRYDADKRLPYTVETRWQILKRCATLENASAYYDSVRDGTIRFHVA